MKELKKPDSCPECGSSEIKRIVGGRPDQEGMRLIENGEAIAGDCFLREWKEDWHCHKCAHKWCDRSDPARIELEALYLNIIENQKS